MHKTLVWIYFLILLPNVILGQQVATDPASTHIFPAGGRRGTVVKVRVGGECLPPLTRMRVAGDGLAAADVLTQRAQPNREPSLRRKPGELHINYPKEWNSQFEIAPDAELGPRFWWLACARGGTGARPFLIGDLPEHIEVEPNSLPDTAERVEMPVTLNGQIDGERDMDYYRFRAREGEVIVAEVTASRIGSPLETAIEFHDKTGHRLMVQEILLGSDPIIAFRAPGDGEFVMSVANLGAAGGPHFVYRITLSKEPFTIAGFPAGGPAERAIQIELLTMTGMRHLQPWSTSVTLPTAGDVFRWSPPDKRGSVSLNSSDYAEVVESEPNNKPLASLPVGIPVTFNGRFATMDDEDWYSFSARQGQPLSFECRPPTGSGLPLLPNMSVHDVNGNLLAKASAVDLPSRVPTIEAWTPPSDGTYWLRICDLQQGVPGNEYFIYRASIVPSRSDFELSLKNDWGNHLPGGRTEIEVMIRRRGGFANAIQIQVEGLPEGIRAEPCEVPVNAVSTKLVLTSEANKAIPTDVLLRVCGTAAVDGKPLCRIARAPHLGRDAEGTSVGPPTTDLFHLTVQQKPLFRLYCSEAYQYAHRGTIYPYFMQVERFDGFNGPITLQVADRQNKDLDGIEVLEVLIPQDHNQVMLPIYLPETMHINVQAHSNVYAQGIAFLKDRLGQDQSTCIVSEMRCMIRTLPTAARLYAVDRNLSLTSGGLSRCRLRLDRTPLFTGALRIVPWGLANDSGIAVDETTIPAGQSEASVQIRASQNANLSEPLNLTLRGTGELGEGTTLVTQAVVNLRMTESPGE